MSDKAIMPADMCHKHQALLVHQAGYGPDDTWQALIVVAQVVLFQAATCDQQTHARIGNDISRIGELGCLACYKPDAFGEVVEVAKTHNLKNIKELGERWIEAARIDGYDVTNG